MNSCKGRCGPYIVGSMGGGRAGNNNHRTYVKGYCRCSVCDQYLKWDGLWCPCCGTRVRNRNRTSKVRRIRVDAAPRVDQQPVGILS